MNNSFHHGGAKLFFSVDDFLLLFSFSANSLCMLCKGCDRRTLISKLKFIQIVDLQSEKK